MLHRFCQQVAPTPPPATGAIFVVAPDAEAIFDQMPKDFVFTSGAGGWATQLTIHPDGIFDGTYYDSNLGDTGPGYPNGTVYYCVFKGSWKDVTQTNPWEYRMYLESLSYTAPSGVTTIQNGHPVHRRRSASLWAEQPQGVPPLPPWPPHRGPTWGLSGLGPHSQRLDHPSLRAAHLGTV